MKRRAIVAGVVLLALAGAFAIYAVRSGAQRRMGRHGSPASGSGRPADEATVARLQGIPFYRALLRGNALRSGSVDRDGTLHLEVDLRALVATRLNTLGFTDAAELLPLTARGTIVIESPNGATSARGLRESWILDAPAAVFDLLDRHPVGEGASLALDAIPGTPSALVRVRLSPSHLADPSFGGTALASWRDRAAIAEKLLGRPLRAEIAEDLAGPAVFALYDTEGDTEAEAILAVELRRSDRIAGLLDMLFALGALTERATVRRYRGIASGSFVSDSLRPGLALAVDGPILFVATSRARLESAIDARRAGPERVGSLPAVAGDSAASWNAVSASSFVAHGWSRLARSVDDQKRGSATTRAALWPEGSSGWRLEGSGPAPAITADPLLPFLRGVFGQRQREGD